MAGAHVDLLTVVARGGGDWHARTTILGEAARTDGAAGVWGKLCDSIRPVGGALRALSRDGAWSVHSSSVTRRDASTCQP